jgi:hypothetical protein
MSSENFVEDFCEEQWSFVSYLRQRKFNSDITDLESFKLIFKLQKILNWQLTECSARLFKQPKSSILNV